jgi:hypothetical protein
VAPDEHVDVVLVKPRCGMQRLYVGGLQDGLGRLSGSTSGCHDYLVIGENWVCIASMVCVTCS